MLRSLSFGLLLTPLFTTVVLAAEPPARPPEAAYIMLPQRDRDGIGKAYFGREIAQVMGHQAAAWLERPERQE